MDILILKTNIKTIHNFKPVEKTLRKNYKINECTVDFGDRDKVLRIVGNNLNQNEVINKIKDFGFACEELIY